MRALSHDVTPDPDAILDDGPDSTGCGSLLHDDIIASTLTPEEGFDFGALGEPGKEWWRKDTEYRRTDGPSENLGDSGGGVRPARLDSGR